MLRPQVGGPISDRSWSTSPLIGLLCGTLNPMNRDLVSSEQRDAAVSIIIVTALEVEQAAVSLILDGVDAELDGVIYGQVSFGGEVAHRLAVGVLPQAGNTAAAASVAEWAGRFANARYIMMVGIAAGVPTPDSAETHVRLGDVVVSNSEPVVEHDRGKVTDRGFKPLFGGAGAPAAVFVKIARSLIGGALAGKLPWQGVLEDRFSAPPWQRPDVFTDRLAGSDGSPIEHPDPDNYRIAGFPRLIAGVIASGDQVVKAVSKRNEIALTTGARAIEMEGFGLGSASWLTEREYFVIRGIVDYADGNKNDAWHLYGAASAAATLRVMLDRKSTTLGELPGSSTPLSEAHAQHLAAIREAATAAIVAARSTRPEVESAVGRWQAEHKQWNAAAGAWDPETGERLTAYLSKNRVHELRAGVLAALNTARQAVEAPVANASAALQLMIDGLDDPAAHAWGKALDRDVKQLASAAAIWPDNESGNRFEPPPGNDGGALERQIAQVISTLTTFQRRLSGQHVPEPDAQPAETPAGPSPEQQWLEDLVQLEELLATYARAERKPFDRQDHARAVAAALEVYDIPFLLITDHHRLGFFPIYAARIARRASDDVWKTLIEEAASLPLKLGVELLSEYRQVLETDERSALAEAAQDTRLALLEAVPALLETDEFWTDHPGNSQYVLRSWATTDRENDLGHLLADLAQRSNLWLCRVLAVLANTARSENQFTGRVTFQLRISSRSGPTVGGPAAATIRAAIATFLPEAEHFNVFAERSDAEQCLGLAAEFLNAYPQPARD